MTRITRFVIWICSKFTRLEIELIILGLQDVLASRNPEVKPKDDFKEKHPNYRDFYVDPFTPFTEGPARGLEDNCYDWKQLLKEHEARTGKPLRPVNHRSSSARVEKHITCRCCSAPHIYLSYNDGKKRSQVRCKVCSTLFQKDKRRRVARKAKHFCPHCAWALYIWKERPEVSIYKCPNYECPVYLSALDKLNAREKTLRKNRSSQFKLHYQYREYHFKPEELHHSGPSKPRVDITKIHASQNVLGLVLAFHVSFGIPARKTAQIMRSIFGVKISYQTVLNYAEAAAYYCHQFNLNHKGRIDDISAGDETYIKIQGKHAYVFFFVSTDNHKITSYHVADSRDTLPATVSMLEASRTASKDQSLSFVTDGNPSYPAGLHYINLRRPDNPIFHHKVVGLQNLDDESELYRRYKQIIERLNRTYKAHVRPAHGFNGRNGAVALTTLFVTHYNFLRPHFSLGHDVPCPLPELEGISNLQGKWNKILSLALTA